MASYQVGTQKKKKSKYSIANFISTQRLSESLKAFAYQLSFCYIPNNVENALPNPRCAQAIKEKLGTQWKNNTWKLVLLPK